MRLKISLLMTLALFLAAVAYAAAGDHHKKTVTGILSDVACSANAKGHPVSCALKESCANSGFAINADGKVYKLDKAGNDKALALLKATKKQKDVVVEVVGELDGETIKVDSIKEKA
jgi:hypothetical protein